MIQTVQIELSINNSTARSQIKIKDYVTGHLWDMFYDSKFSSYSLVIEKVTEKGYWTIYRPDKKAKKVSENWKWTFHEGQY